MTAAAASQRELGFWTCTALVVGNVIGIGVFVLPSDLAPFGFAAVWAWLLVGAGCLVLARVLGALARAMPDAAGPYGYVRQTFGTGVAFAMMWCYWVSLWITNAALAVGVVGYLLPLLPAGMNALVGQSLCIWLPVVVNLFGVRTGGRVQVLATVLKLVPIAVVVAVGIWILVASDGPVPRHPVESASGTGSILAAASIALFAMLGIESATVPAERVRDPGRTLPRATLAGTIATAVICVLASSVPLLVLPQAELARSSAPFVAVLDAWFGAGSGSWVAIFVAISGLGALNGWTLLAGELTRTLADDGLMPEALGRTNRCGAPVGALLLVGVLGNGLVLLNSGASGASGFAFLSAVVTAANLPLYLFCSVALFVVASRGDTGSRTQHCWLAVLGATIVVLAFVGMGSEPFWSALALVAAGVPWYWLRRRGQRCSSRASANTQ